IGAGLAGAAAAERLAARGWRIDLVERHSEPAAEASGLPAGAVHPLIARDDSVLSRLTRAGFLYALRYWRALAGAPWRPCGVLQLARDSHEEARMKLALDELSFPPGYVEYLPSAEAGRRVGCEVRAGGLWFSCGGWMRPAALVAAQLDAASAHGAGLAMHAGREVKALARDGGRWIARSADGRTIAAAPVCVLASACDAARFAEFGGELKPVRGQITHLPPGSCGGLTAVIAGARYLVPAPDNIILGATYDCSDADPAPRASGHAGNLVRLAHLLRQPPHLDASVLDGSVGFRCTATDRLPLIGAAPDVGAARLARAGLS